MEEASTAAEAAVDVEAAAAALPFDALEVEAMPGAVLDGGMTQA